jgi:hypothetical protein
MESLQMDHRMDTRNKQGESKLPLLYDEAYSGERRNRVILVRLNHSQ